MALRPCKECKQPISTDAQVCPHCGKRVGGSSLGKGCLLAILVFILIGAIGSAIRQTPSNSPSSSTAAVDPKAATLSQVKLDFRWRKEGFGNVMEADFTVKNNSDHDIKDFEITCEHYANSGTLIDSNKRTVYEIVKAHSTRKFPNFNMGFIHTQAANSRCGVTDLVVQ